MDKEKDKKGLKAFWCMLDTAKEKGRSVSYSSNYIYVWANKKEGSGRIGEIEIRERERETLVGKRFFGLMTVSMIDTYYVVYGEVVNTKDGKTHYFSFENKSALDVRKEILERIKIYYEEKAKEEEASLNELLC